MAEMEARVDVETLSIKQLRELVISAGLSHADCVEKSDLKTRALEAQRRLELAAASSPAPATRSSGAGTTRDVTLAGYECSLQEPTGDQGASRAPDLLIIILHGFGATNSDFASVPSGLAGELCRVKRVAWLFPQAEAGGSMGATQWWELDAMKWMMAAQVHVRGGVGAPFSPLGGIDSPMLDECARCSCTGVIIISHSPCLLLLPACCRVRAGRARTPKQKRGYCAHNVLHVLSALSVHIFSILQAGGDALAALIREEPKGLKEARERLKSMVEEATKLVGIALDRVVLAGFSQVLERVT